MLRRPVLLWLLGIGLMLTPSYYYLEQVLTAPVDWADPVAVIGSMPVLKIVASVLAPAVGALVLLVRREGWYAMVGYAAFTVVANAVLFATGRMPFSAFALFVPTGLVCLLYFARREIMSPFFNPRLRRWETDRVRYRAPAVLELDGETLDAETWDVSSSGAFLALGRPVEPGTRFTLRLHLEAAPLVLQAEAVWGTAGNGDRPRGIGAKFDRAAATQVARALAAVERRAEPRMPFRLRVDLAAHESIECETFDLSATGCYLVTDRSFQVGAELQLKLHLDEPIEVGGTVVRVTAGGDLPPGIGVRFRRPPRKLSEALRQLRTRA